MLSTILLKALQKAMDFRFDGQPCLSYFDEKDVGISAEPFSFLSGKCLLRGKKYFLDGQKHKAVVIFFHGAGAGHSAYTLEISALVKQGYLVYAYDCTGCMTSEGTGFGNFAQSLLDQEAFFRFLDQEPSLDLPRYAIGHSWGGFTALGALKKDYHVSKAVCISGFFSVADMLCLQAPKLKKFESLLYRALKKGYGDYGVKSMLDLMEESDAEVLYIQGEADPVVPKPMHYDVLVERFQNNSRVHALLVPGAMHNPYWTLEAQKYFLEIQKKHHILDKSFDNHASIDYAKLNCDDPKVMKAIFDFLRA